MKSLPNLDHFRGDDRPVVTLEDRLTAGVSDGRTDLGGRKAVDRIGKGRGSVGDGDAFAFGKKETLDTLGRGDCHTLVGEGFENLRASAATFKNRGD